jgi:survival of motor neuron-related-splicing factor 30
VAAPTRRRVVDDTDMAEEMPRWLEIKPTDDDKTRLRKRKLIKSFKSKQRFSQMDAAQKQKADAWKSFVSKGKKKSGMKGIKSNPLNKPPISASTTRANTSPGGQAVPRRHDFRNVPVDAGGDV